MLWRLSTAVLLIALVALAATYRARGEGVGFELRVIDRETRAPVAGCELRWMSAARIDALARPRTEPRAETLRRFGRVTRTDAAGRAWLAGWGPGALHWLDARAGELHEQTFFWSQPAGPVTVEVEREVELTVLVRDAADAPAVGVPVAVLSERETLATAWTDAAGVARPRCASRLLDTNEVLVVTFAFPTRSGRGRPLGEAARAGEPVSLRVPATGGVAIELLGTDGAPRAVDLDLNVRRRVAMGEPQPATWHVQVEDGRGLLEPCEVGVPLEVWGRPLGVLGMVPFERVPRAPGERVELRFVLPAPRVELAARVLGPDGRPLRNASLSIERVHEPGRAPRQETARTNGQGRLEVLDDPWSAQAPLTSVLVRHRDAKHAVFEASAEVDAEWVEPIELGDLVLEPVPLVARGRVVDGEGRAVAGAWVGLWLDHFDGWGGTARRTFVRSGRDGGFELHAHLGAGSYTLHASATGYVSHRDVPLGDPDLPLELVLQRPVRVEGRAQPADLPAAEHVSVAIVSDGGSRSLDRSGLSPDGSFALEKVPPGEHELWIELQGVGTLARWPLTVPRVDVFRPEAFADIDLAALLLELPDGAARRAAALYDRDRTPK